jgi:dihydroxy-acid dehydratase
LLVELKPWLDLTQVSITGKQLEASADAAEMVPGQRVIRSPQEPLREHGAIAVLRGTLAPQGALIKHSAASRELLVHEGRAVVFDSVEDMAERIDREDLDVEADDVLVLRNAGPVGGPGMPEAGQIPIPRKLALRGVRDMVRISDARMSGTAYGTIVLHVAPEGAVGGPIALLATGDRIRLDVPGRSIELLVDEDELSRRRDSWRTPVNPAEERGYRRLFLESVQQAPQGCDFSFCLPTRTQ